MEYGLADALGPLLMNAVEVGLFRAPHGKVARDEQTIWMRGLSKRHQVHSSNMKIRPGQRIQKGVFRK